MYLFYFLLVGQHWNSKTHVCISGFYQNFLSSRNDIGRKKTQTWNWIQGTGTLKGPRRWCSVPLLSLSLSRGAHPETHISSFLSLPILPVWYFNFSPLKDNWMRSTNLLEEWSALRGCLTLLKWRRIVEFSCLIAWWVRNFWKSFLKKWLYSIKPLNLPLSLLVYFGHFHYSAMYVTTSELGFSCKEWYTHTHTHTKYNNPNLLLKFIYNTFIILTNIMNFLCWIRF